MRRHRSFTAALVVLGAILASASPAQDLSVPNRSESLKFAAIGDNGTGELAEYDVGRQMTAYHGRFPFEIVIVLGHNLYGRQEPQDFVTKFEEPIWRK